MNELIALASQLPNWDNPQDVSQVKVPHNDAMKFGYRVSSDSEVVHFTWFVKGNRSTDVGYSPSTKTIYWSQAAGNHWGLVSL